MNRCSLLEAFMRAHESPSTQNMIDDDLIGSDIDDGDISEGVNYL